MGFVGNLFTKAAEIGQLGRHINFLQAQLDREIWKREALEKSLKAERAAKDRVLLRHADMMSVKAALHGAFVKDAEQKAVVPPTISQEDKERIRWMAEQMRTADLDEKGQAPDLQVYIDKIAESPDDYLVT